MFIVLEINYWLDMVYGFLISSLLEFEEIYRKHKKACEGNKLSGIFVPEGQLMTIYWDNFYNLIYFVTVF